MNGPRILRLSRSERWLERMRLDHGAEILLSRTALEQGAREGDIVLLGDERLLVAQASPTEISYQGMSGPSSRMAMAVTPLASVSMGPDDQP